MDDRELKPQELKPPEPKPQELEPQELEPQEQWRAVHQALLAELRWRMAGHDLLITEATADDLVDNLADAVVAKFELTPRPPRTGWFRPRRGGWFRRRRDS